MRKAIASAVLSLVAVVFLGGCLPRFVPVDDAEVSAACRTFFSNTRSVASSRKN